jgi:hypothetical protein
MMERLRKDGRRMKKGEEAKPGDKAYFIAICCRSSVEHWGPLMQCDNLVDSRALMLGH